MTRHWRIAAAFIVTMSATAGIASGAHALAPCHDVQGYAASFEGRRTFLWRPERLQHARERIRADPADPAYRALLDRAEKALDHPRYSVIDKTRLPATGDPHDYVSVGPYWWPDPSRPDGLPYIRRDGERNPDNAGDTFDAARMAAFSSDIEALALAYYFTGKTAYAHKAASQIRAWFLDPSTRMNPSLDLGQSVPGRTAGRAEGIIDLNRLVPVVESLGLLEPSGALTADDIDGLKAWFGHLADWMLTSPLGREEAAAKNNHGVFYDAFVVQFSLYAGLRGSAADVVRRAPNRLAQQIEPDGRMPHELTRTKSLHYSTWTLTGAFDLADLSRCVGEDLWAWRSQDGRSLRDAADFLATYAGREAEWPYPELDRSASKDLREVLRRGALEWSDPKLADLARLYDSEDPAALLTLLVPPFAP